MGTRFYLESIQTMFLQNGSGFFSQNEKREPIGWKRIAAHKKRTRRIANGAPTGSYYNLLVITIM
jgi:hypothetical protein